MYHVTNQSAKQPVPNWNEIEPCSIANDATYDGDLLGLPLASFTTTRYKDAGTIGFPTVSPYPRNITGTQYGGSHHRVKIWFNKTDFFIYNMSNHITEKRHIRQIQLLCIRKNGRDDFENEVYGILLKHFKKNLLEAHNLNEFFPNGQANVYDKNSHHKMFVNVHFTYSVDATGAEWDTVQKLTTVGHGDIDQKFDYIKLDSLRSLWCLQHNLKALTDKIKDLENIPEVRQILAPLQSNLKSLFDQRDEDLIKKLTEMYI